MNQLKKLTAMEKLITCGFLTYKTCDNEYLKESVLTETQVEGIDQIKTEIKMFIKQRDVAFQDLVKENQDLVTSSIKIFKRDLDHLKKFLDVCKRGENQIEKTLKPILEEYIPELQNTIEVLEEALD